MEWEVRGMAYATQDDYTKWLQGSKGVIPLAEFPRWSSRATIRINKNKVDLQTIPIYLVECTCEVAEILFKDNQTKQAGELKSMSIGGYSESYVDQKQETGKLKQEIDGTIRDYLAFTDLHNDFIFRGAYA